MWITLVQYISSLKSLVAGYCKHSNEPSDSIKSREFLGQLTISFTSKTVQHKSELEKCLNTIKFLGCFNCLNSMNECFMVVIMLHVYWFCTHYAVQHYLLIGRWSLKQMISNEKHKYYTEKQHNTGTPVHINEKKHDRIIKTESNNYEDVWRRAMNMKLQTQRAGGSSQCTFMNNTNIKMTNGFDTVHCLHLLQYAIIRSL